MKKVLLSIILITIISIAFVVLYITPRVIFSDPDHLMYPGDANENHICKSLPFEDYIREKFLCIGSDVPRRIDPDFDRGFKSRPNYSPGHILILEDFENPGNENSTRAYLTKNIIDDVIKLGSPYDKLSIIKLPGYEGDNPRNITIDPHIMYSGYILREESDTNNYNVLGSYPKYESDLPMSFRKESPLIESIKMISMDKVADFSDDYEYRKIIIISNLLQHSRSMSLIRSCRDQGGCISYDDLKARYNPELWEGLKPEFGINPPEVFVYYLSCKYDQNLDIGLIEIWESYFEELEMKMTYEIETGCRAYE